MEIAERYSDISQATRAVSHVLSLVLYVFTFVIFAALWSDSKFVGLTLVEISLLTFSAIILTPLLTSVMLPYSAPGFMYRYCAIEECRIATTSRIGLPLTVGLTSGTLFLLLYGARITREVSLFGVYYIIVGIVGFIGALYFAINWLRCEGKFSTVLDMSHSNVSMTSMGTKVELDTSSCVIQFKNSKMRPNITLSGKAKVTHRDGRTEIEQKSIVVNNFNAGKVNIYVVRDLISPK